MIDEVQRAPGLILGLKKAVDEHPRAGRFLITGSVDLFQGMISPDSLAGRVETIELLPFSQAEVVQRAPPDFLARPSMATSPRSKNGAERPTGSNAPWRAATRRRSDGYRNLRYNLAMRVISNQALLRFSADHKDAEEPLQAWRKAVESGKFGSFADVKACFNSVDRVGRYYVFNIGGNKYRVIAAIHFNRQLLFVRHIFTHRQYDRWKP